MFLYIWSSDIPEKGPAAFWEPDSAHTAVAVYSGHMDKACESCYLEPKVIYSLGRQISWAVGKAEPAFKDSCAFNLESPAKCNSGFL